MRISAILVLFTAFLAKASSPDEGMWLPMYLKSLNEKDMKARGLKLTADDIYNINKSSLKDAVVQLGNFCTGEIVSAEGLMLTNHHCGYDNIAQHSSVENNYLRDGFWAKTKSEELANPGLTASILVRMENVTDIIKGKTKAGEQLSQLLVAAAMDSIEKAAVEGTHYIADVKPFYKGNEYYLLVYEVFTDVRLVGAPPSSIGKFGGDTDNWMWPRHTGDFSVFRIYAGKDGKPAPYSPDNVPYKPKHHFAISTQGVKNQDYAMVIGFPGSTDRYLTSYDLEVARDLTNPAIVEAFGKQLEAMKRDMDSDPKLKIDLASDYASMSNTYKYYIGQNRQLKQADVIVKKQENEKAFTQWVNADNSRKEKYGTILSNVKNSLDQYKTIEPALSYFFYGLFSTGSMKYAFGNYYTFYRMHPDPKSPPKQSELDSVGALTAPRVEAYFNGVTYNTDKKVLKEILVLMYNKLGDKRPEFLTKAVQSQKKAANPEAAISNYVDDVYAKSMILNKEKAMAFLKKPNYQKKLLKDPMFELAMNSINYYSQNLAVTYQQKSGSLKSEHEKYIAALREWQKDKTFYPDANSTLRVTYGNVKPYYPRDGVFYDYFTTHEGILEKQNPNDAEFVVPEKMLDLLRKKQFGRYAEKDTLRVNFISNNDITGGNSGSPVLNANGELIGIAFDGNWESMIGDLYVDPALNRTISVDIRYVLWVIDEFAGAKHLINEMSIK